MSIPHDEGGGGAGGIQKTWDELFPGLAPRPLRGRSYQYAAAATQCRNLREAMEFCSSEFRRLTGDDGLHTLKGSAPDALANLLEQIDGSFHDLPPVFEGLETALSNHNTRLVELEAAAVTALARANTRWNALRTARSEHDDADAALTAINSQILTLRSATDETSAAELAELEGRLPTVRSTLGSKANAVEQAETNLAASRTEYGNLRSAEDDLIEETRKAIERIDLGDLEDPGWLESKLADIGEFFTDIASNLAKAFEALMNGDFLDALHHLSDALNSTLVALAVIVIAIVVVIAVFATGGAALALLTAIATGLAVLKLGIDAILAGTGHPHPETGRPKTWREVLIDAALLIVPVPGSRALSRSISSRLLARVPPSGYTSARATRTYRQNERIIAAAQRGTGMGSRQNGNHLTARQVRERAVEARRYNNAYDQAHATHQANVDRAVQTGHDAGDAGAGAVTDLVAEGGKKAAEPVLAGRPEAFGAGDVNSVSDHPAVQEGARRHVDRCSRAMQGYHRSGPSGQPNTPYVCLVAAS